LKKKIEFLFCLKIFIISVKISFHFFFILQFAYYRKNSKTIGYYVALTAHQARQSS